MTGQNYQHHLGRRTALRTMAAGIGLAAVGTVSAGHEKASPYASVNFTDQTTDGYTLTIARARLGADGFMTIHTWDLIDEQDGPNTIVGVSGPLESGIHKWFPVVFFHPGMGYSRAESEDDGGFHDVTRLQDILDDGQDEIDLIAVPHRDVNHSGEFEFAGEEHTDIPFQNGPREEENLPVDNAVNDVATVSVDGFDG